MDGYWSGCVFILYRRQTDRTATHKKLNIWLYTAEGLEHVDGPAHGAPFQFAVKGFLAARTVCKVPIENVEANPIVSGNISGDRQQIIRVLLHIIEGYNS